MPGRAPKLVIKKTKKLKENEKQNAEKGSDIQEGGGDEIDSAEIKADKSADDFIEERRDDHNIVQTTNAHVQNIPMVMNGPSTVQTHWAFGMQRTLVPQCRLRGMRKREMLK